MSGKGWCPQYHPFLKGVGIIKRKKKKSFKLIRCVLVVLLVFAVAGFIQVRLKIAEIKKEIHENQLKIIEKKKEQEVIQNEIDNYEFYLEKKAREKGYGYPGESIYIEIS